MKKIPFLITWPVSAQVNTGSWIKFSVESDVDNQRPYTRVVQLSFGTLEFSVAFMLHGMSVLLAVPIEGENMEPHQRKCREVCKYSTRKGTGLFVSARGCDGR